mmetsp:Transcript_150094/g.262131  ORF Transcript_150094/g.262131 Transcript_150094/m.262131 type:complete len:277 (-) Transcript_150094:27-857(-)
MANGRTRDGGPAQQQGMNTDTAADPQFSLRGTPDDPREATRVWFNAYNLAERAWVPGTLQAFGYQLPTVAEGTSVCVCGCVWVCVRVCQQTGCMSLAYIQMNARPSTHQPTRTYGRTRAHAHTRTHTIKLHQGNKPQGCCDARGVRHDTEGERGGVGGIYVLSPVCSVPGKAVGFPMVSAATGGVSVQLPLVYTMPRLASNCPPPQSAPSWPFPAGRAGIAALRWAMGRGALDRHPRPAEARVLHQYLCLCPDFSWWLSWRGGGWGVLALCVSPSF